MSLLPGRAVRAEPDRLVEPASPPVSLIDPKRQDVVSVSANAFGRRDHETSADTCSCDVFIDVEAMKLGRSRQRILIRAGTSERETDHSPIAIGNEDERVDRRLCESCGPLPLPIVDGKGIENAAGVELAVPPAPPTDMSLGDGPNIVRTGLADEHAAQHTPTLS